MIPVNRNPSRRELRLFSLLWFPLLVMVAGSVLYWKAALPRTATCLWIAGAATAVVGFVFPVVAKYLFLVLSYLTYPIGWLVGNAMLAVIYFLIVFPIGLALKFKDFDPLGRHFDRAAKSYWKPRSTPTEKEQYFRQF